MTKELIKNYQYLVFNIIEMTNNTDPAELYLQKNDYVPATICHPVWTLGHLCISAQGICEEMLLDHWLPGDWMERYGQESTPVSDSAVYESREKLTAVLMEAVQIVEQRVKDTTRETFLGPMPDVRFHDVFPTLFHAVSGILIDHTAEHLRMLLQWKYFVLGQKE